MTKPNRHKMALLTWLVVYPMITVLLAVLEPVLSNAAMPLRTLVLSLIMVPALVYGAMPFATARLKDWLSEPSGPGATREEKPGV
ncbi:hypothetical protein [Roseibium sp. MMSF_3412]|uniref:hypothetical protein n=1 Tax=Roseibium sp. MMSF_3412 TaxID=3046712 RepID=UPI00273EB0CA|nr:hypothetical protein [Roseibium sp. MMSF_3412]